MKAIRLHRYGGPEVLVLEDVAEPVPGPGQVLIRVEAAAVNFADVMRRRNDPYPLPSPLPFTPGGEVAGTVAALGLGVERLEVGLPVFATVGRGGSEGYAQFAVANAVQVVPVPPGLDATHACALVIAGVTAVLILRDVARLQPAETVLVQAAAGGVGGYAVQLAKLLGAGKIVAGASLEDKRLAAMHLGADLAIDYTQPGWDEKARQLVGGSGFDVILDMTGGRVSSESFGLLGLFGRMVVYGAASGEPYTIGPQQLIGPSQSVTGFYLGTWFGSRLPQAVDALQILVGHVLSGRLQVQIGRVLPLAQAGDAHRFLESRQSTGKIVLRPWDDGLSNES